VSDEILKRAADAYRRLRNTARYLLSNLHGFDPAVNLVDINDMLALDRWVMDRALNLQQALIEAYDSYQFHQVYQQIHHFCSVDLGSFYLDIIKDRQYTMQADSLGRRSAQTAMFHIAEALARWLAPITAFTADEIWQHLPGERGDSVLLETWYQGLHAIDDTVALSCDDWERVLVVREAVSKELEVLRGQSAIGASLDAEVVLYCDEQHFQLLNRLGRELHFIFITSYASVMAMEFMPAEAKQTDLDGVKLMVTVSEHEKCVRCWHHREDVGVHDAHPELCGRCVANVADSGEVRQYA
jgi:isoleucyl-tRNA synthetase